MRLEGELAPPRVAVVLPAGAERELGAAVIQPETW
jgi:hypothetical protein